jgi:hypothetical protein
MNLSLAGPGPQWAVVPAGIMTHFIFMELPYFELFKNHSVTFI